MNLRSVVAACAVLPALTVSACVVGPNYGGPPHVAPRAATGAPFARADAGVSSGEPTAGRWWTALRDPVLDRLEDAALAGSADLEVYRARIVQSRADLRSSRAGRLPKISASAAYLRSSGANSLLTGGGAAVAAAAAGATGSQSQAEAAAQNQDFEYYNLGGIATWEPDLFGGQARAVEAAKARDAAARLDLDAARVSLTAEVASAYVSLRDVQTRLVLQREDAALEQRVIADTRLRVAGGTASELDAERLNDQFQSVQAEVAPLQAQVAAQLDRLAVLTGREPGALDAELTAVAAPPLPPASLVVGDPASLLRRRPDVRAAERRIQAANAVIGQHTADLFPKVTVFGNLGFGASDVTRVLSGDSFTYAVAPFLQWSVFDFGRVRAQIDLAKGRTAEAVASYRSAVLGALQDAETSLATYGRQRERVAALLRVQASADRVWRMTALRVAGGTASTIDQLDAERRRVAARQNVAASQAQLTLDFCTLQKSLGLGWIT